MLSWFVLLRVVFAALAVTGVLLQGQHTPAREVAITFDDLPIGGTVDFTVADWERITRELVGSIARHRIPAIGFVNEMKLERGGKVEERRVALLRQWLAAGLELGNHSYSHPDLNTTPRDVFERDVLRGEEVTRRLLAEKGLVPRFFRHPFLRTGRSLDVRNGFEAFLKQHGYRVAPVTIDNNDYIFANAFDRATDARQRTRIADAYIAYMTSVVAYYERASTAIVGREIRQILLLHASALNAHTLDALAGMLKSRGYAFVSLDRALEDPAYASPDTYVGPGGITWLHRWALTQGKRGSFFAGEPVVPEWVEHAATARPH